MAKKFYVLGGWHGGKYIRISKYNKTANGVEIEIKHNVKREKGRSLRWVQTIAENGSFFKDCGKRYYVDPWGPSVSPAGKMVCKADDFRPFYWTNAEFKGGDGPYFYDRPSESKPAKGKTWIRFVTSLTEARGKSVMLLATIVWGFDINATGKVTVISVRRAKPFERSGHINVLKWMYPKYTYTYPVPDTAGTAMA